MSKLGRIKSSFSQFIIDVSFTICIYVKALELTRAKLTNCCRLVTKSQHTTLSIFYLLQVLIQNLSLSPLLKIVNYSSKNKSSKSFNQGSYKSEYPKILLILITLDPYNTRRKGVLNTFQVQRYA